jgi:L-rhamnose isomerase
MSSPEEMRTDVEAVLRIADELDALADDPTAGVRTFEKVTNKLRKERSAKTGCIPLDILVE